MAHLATFLLAPGQWRWLRESLGETVLFLLLLLFLRKEPVGWKPWGAVWMGIT